MKTYSIDDGNGNQLTTGLSEHEAHATAQRIANDRGETVYLYEDGGEYEAIEPTEDDDQPESVRAETEIELPEIADVGFEDVWESLGVEWGERWTGEER